MLQFFHRSDHSFWRDVADKKFDGENGRGSMAYGRDGSFEDMHGLTSLFSSFSLHAAHPQPHAFDCNDDLDRRRLHPNLEEFFAGMIAEQLVVAHVFGDHLE